MIFRRKDNDGFQTFSITGWLLAPFRRLTAAYRDLTEDESSGFHEELTGGQRFTAILTYPFRLLWGIGFFLVMAWTTSRNGFAFLRGTPALAFAFVFLFAVWASDSLINRGAHAIARYQYHLNFSPEKPENALMFAEKMVQLRPQETALLYQLGVSHERMKNEDEAFNIMSSLASQNTDGQSNANVWLARHYARKSIVELDENKYDDQIRQHLLDAYDADEDNIFALIGLADFYYARNELDQAVKYLDVIVSGEIANEIQIQQYPRLIQIKQKLGLDELADIDFRSALRKVIPIARRYPERFQIWFSLVQSAVLVKDYEEANQIIQEGFQSAKDPEIRQKIARLASAIMITNADDFPDLDNEEHFKKRLYALCDAIRRNPRNREAYTRLIDYAIIKEDQSERAYWLRRSILGCPNPAVIHILLGMADISNGNFVRAQEQWKIAEHEFEGAQFVVNNMIEIAINERPDDFGNIMDMVTVAIELFDSQPVLYQTRASYLMSEGRYDEAVNDLLYTIKNMPRLVTARKKLVECYEKSGNQAAADEQKSQLNEILLNLDEEQRKLVDEVLNR